MTKPFLARRHVLMGSLAFLPVSQFLPYGTGSGPRRCERYVKHVAPLLGWHRADAPPTKRDTELELGLPDIPVLAESPGRTVSHVDCGLTLGYFNFFGMASVTFRITKLVADRPLDMQLLRRVVFDIESIENKEALSSWAWSNRSSETEMFYKIMPHGTLNFTPQSRPLRVKLYVRENTDDLSPDLTVTFDHDILVKAWDSAQESFSIVTDIRENSTCYG